MSSGDLVIDRRAQYARMLAEAGDFVAAADLMEQAMEQSPAWAPGWMMAGEFHLKADMLGAAIAAWQRAAELDPQGILGAQMHLAAHGIGEVDLDKQAAYVEALFDHYADRFEEELLQKLDYSVPEKLAALIADVMEQRSIKGFAQGLDLGCGTGLMGERLHHIVSHIFGVDISAAMVAETRAKSIYDGVEQGELLAFLEEGNREGDIVTAADVFIYCPSLLPIFAAVAKVLREGGLFAFSVERHDGPEDQMLQASLRYAHSRAAIARELAALGFDIVHLKDDVLRHDRGAPINGLLVVAQKPKASIAAIPELMDFDQIEALAEPVVEG